MIAKRRISDYKDFSGDSLLTKQLATVDVKPKNNSGVQIAEMLIKHGANVSHVDHRGKTALFTAALFGNFNQFGFY